MAPIIHGGVASRRGLPSCTTSGGDLVVYKRRPIFQKYRFEAEGSRGNSTYNELASVYFGIYTFSNFYLSGPLSLLVSAHAIAPKPKAFIMLPTISHVLAPLSVLLAVAAAHPAADPPDNCSTRTVCIDKVNECGMKYGG